MALDTLLSTNNTEQRTPVCLPKGNLLVGRKVEVRRLGVGFDWSWHSATVTGWMGSVRRVRYDKISVGANGGCDRLVELIDVSSTTKIGEDCEADAEGECKRFRGLIRPALASSSVDKWSLNYGLCVDACVNGSWCESVVIDEEVGFEERLIFFPDSGDQKRVSVEQLRITRDWNQGLECWKSRGNWLFLETLEGYGLGSLSANVCLKQIWHNVRDREEYQRRLVDWTCRDRAMWDLFVLDIIRDMGLASKQVSDDGGADGLRETATKRRKTSDTQLLHCGGSLDEFDEETIGAVQDGNDFMSVEEEAKETDPQHDTTNGECSSDESSWSAAKHLGARKRGEGQWRPAGIDMIPGAKRIPQALVEYYAGYRNGKPRDAKSILQADARRHLLYLGWRIEFTRKGNILRFRYISPDGDTKYSLIQICESLIKPKGKTWDKVIEKGHKNMGNVPAELVNSSVFKEVVRRSLKLSGREVENPSEVSPRHPKTPVSSVPAAEALDVSGDGGTRLNPEAVILWNEIGSDREKRKRYKQKDTLNKAKNHLVAVGWKLWYKEKNGRQELRYTSPKGKHYISLVQACKAYVEGGMETGLQDGNLNDEELKSPGIDEKLFTPTSECSKEDPCTNTGSKSDILDDEKLKPLGVADRLSIPTSKCSEEDHCTNTGLQSDILDVEELKPLGVADRSSTPKSECSEEDPDTDTGSQSDILDDEELETLGVADRLSTPTSKCSEGDGTNNGQTDMSGPVSPDLPEPSLQAIAIRRNQEPQYSHPPHPPKYEQALSQESGDPQMNQKEAVAEGSIATHDLVERRVDSQIKTEAATADSNTTSASLEGHQVNTRSQTSAPQSTKKTRQVLKPRQANRKTILSVLIDNNVVLREAYVYYRGKTEEKPRLVEGRITYEGIRCDCCREIFNLSAFEAHAKSTLHRPAANIFLEDGRSLADCQRQFEQAGGIMSSKGTSHERNKTNRNQIGNKSDLICSVCYYGGTLLLCENCPSAFHVECLGLKDLPEGEWFCPSCRCRECQQKEFNGEIVHSHDKSVISCYQCERKYHVGCARLRGMIELELEDILKRSWFCGGKCEKIFTGLHNILGQPISLGVNEFSWTILKPLKPGRPRNDLPGSGGSMTMREHRRKLKLAVEVMHECFEPVNDPSSDRDIVQDVIFNKRSKLNRLNFSGFYTLLLEREDEIISVATFRIYGDKVAELPLIGTRFQYRRMGMCRILINALEKKLYELGVERLVLPAAKEVLKTWTGSFGFSEMTETERLMFLDYTFMDFQGTTMCQKLLRN